jgi:hypothetical protein
VPLAARCYVTAMMAAAFGVAASVPWSSSPLLVTVALCTLAMIAERLSQVTVTVRGGSMSVSLIITLIAAD